MPLPFDLQLDEPHLRNLLLDAEIPPPLSFDKFATRGAYHQVYILHYTEPQLDDIFERHGIANVHPRHRDKLILRIGGGKIKSENESAIIKHVAAENPRIPVPDVLHFDSSKENAIGAEYQLTTFCTGVAVDDVFRTWDKQTKVVFLDQIILILQQLHSIRLAHVGGFAVSEDGKVIPGPGCEEFNWTQAGLDKYWANHGLKETEESVNALGPYYSWTELQVAWLQKFIAAIEKHPLMEEFRDMLPLLQKFSKVLEKNEDSSWKLNDMRTVLAHRDLHFGNILYDQSMKRISGIIDWEFAGAAPFCKWDPPRAFLGSLPYDEEGVKRKRAWVGDFKKRCDETGNDWRSLIFDHETGWSSSQQRVVYEAMDYLRCIFEVAPLGDAASAQALKDWRKIVEQRVESLGIKTD